ncbi:hypothetical protein DSAG12_02631 [Promethearchaeum syntrophicum]|uniref:Uncharacterized protein n=1 Tax=Promethearchaeum syntrophicum TaxID=2594042 RepID=A0A5B9DCN3_9ARCH|nr:hypothetical protein [Candidatus Prometheoarchaeum syntrophicum]QEE16801.1 hypothetical protein DSAG12_02631 [Candidatus Prometheoarchaeum syntrophicum]
MRNHLFERYTLNLINLINPELIVFNGVDTFNVVSKIFKNNVTENELDRSEYQTEIESITQKLPGITPFFLKGKMKNGKIKIVKDYDFMSLYHTSGIVNPNILEYTKGFFKKFIQKEYLKKLDF